MDHHDLACRHVHLCDPGIGIGIRTRTHDTHAWGRLIAGRRCHIETVIDVGDVKGVQTRMVCVGPVISSVPETDDMSVTWTFGDQLL